MKIFFSFFIVYFFATSLYADEKNEKILRIYNWSDYISVDLLKKFSQQYDVKIEYETYNDAQMMYSKVLQNEKYGVDIVFPSANFVHKLIDENLRH